MSGIIPETEKSDNGIDYPLKNYQHRLHELTQNISRGVAVPSNVGGLCKLTVINEQNLNSDKPDPANGKPSNHQFQKKNVASELEMRSLNLTVESILSKSNKDRCIFKFIMTTFGAIEYVISNPPAHKMNPTHYIDYIHQLVKDKYLLKQFRKASGGSSVISDWAPCIDQYAGNSVRSIQLDKQSNLTQSNFINSEDLGLPISKARTLPSHQKEIFTSIKARSKRSVHESDMQLREILNEGNFFDFLNHNECAQERDKLDDSQVSLSVIIDPDKLNKPVKKSPLQDTNPNKVGREKYSLDRVDEKSTIVYSILSDSVKENSSYNDENLNISVLNETTCSRTSRSGRRLKLPAKFREPGGEEISYDNSNQCLKSLLNESITQQNKKVLEKKKSPPNKGNKTTLVSKPNTKKRGSAQNGKENKVVKNKKVVKKVLEKVVNSISSKGKTNEKKKDSINKVQNTGNIGKKVAPKRKSKESDETISKKKKLEDSTMSGSDNDIFGVSTCKKATHKDLKLVHSQVAALLGTKKARGKTHQAAT